MAALSPRSGYAADALPLLTEAPPGSLEDSFPLSSLAPLTDCLTGEEALSCLVLGGVGIPVLVLGLLILTLVLLSSLSGSFLVVCWTRSTGLLLLMTNCRQLLLALMPGQGTFFCGEN